MAGLARRRFWSAWYFRRADDRRTVGPVKGGALTILTDIRELHVADIRACSVYAKDFAQVLAATALQSSLR